MVLLTNKGWGSRATLSLMLACCTSFLVNPARSQRPPCLLGLQQKWGPLVQALWRGRGDSLAEEPALGWEWGPGRKLAATTAVGAPCLCRVGDAVLGLVCVLLLLMLKLMRTHLPPLHPEIPARVRLSHGLVWTVTTGEAGRRAGQESSGRPE